MKGKATTTFASGTTFTTASTSYVDLLDSSGGSPIAVTITKGSASSVHISGTAFGIMTTATGIVTLGVNDGTNDYDLGRINLFTTVYQPIKGDVVIPGLGGGSKTFKLRVKVSAGTFNFTTAIVSASITATEIAP